MNPAVIAAVQEAARTMGECGACFLGNAGLRPCDKHAEAVARAVLDAAVDALPRAVYLGMTAGEDSIFLGETIVGRVSLRAALLGEDGTA